MTSPGDLGAVQLDVPSARPAMRAAREAATGGSSTLDPPHVSLGYPWALPLDVQRLRAAAARTAPIVARLVDVAVFSTPAAVVHLVVDDQAADAVRSLVRAAGAEDEGLTPHVSLVRLADPDDVDPVVAAARRHLPGEVTLGRLVGSERRAGDWRTVVDVLLGGADDEH